MENNVLPIWTEFPPKGEGSRIDEYARLRQLFKGNHDEVFSRLQTWLESEGDKAIIYIVCNFAGIISRTCADFLFGEPFRAIVGESDSREQQAVNRIINDNNLQTVCYEMALSNSWRGDSVFKARFGKFYGWAEQPQAIIESVPAHTFFPHFVPGNIREYTGATIAFPVELGEKKYLFKEIHLPGQILNELWRLEGSEIKDQVKLSTIPAYAGLMESVSTGYPGLLVEHVPNWRLDDEFWGVSDYSDLESLFDELNNRISKASRILDKHSDPKLILPPGSMQYDDRTNRYYVNKDDLQCFEVDTERVGSDLPRYLVWDAQLEAAFKQIDNLLSMLMMCAEISPSMFGMDKYGVAESGRALKYRLIRTMAKVNRKKKYFDQGLRNILYAAQVMESQYGIDRGFEPRYPRIEWADGLPVDELETAQTEQVRLAAGNTSVESSVRRSDGLEGDELKREMEKIDADRKASMVMVPEVNTDEE